MFCRRWSSYGLSSSSDDISRRHHTRARDARGWGGRLLRPPVRLGVAKNGLGVRSRPRPDVFGQDLAGLGRSNIVGRSKRNGEKTSGGRGVMSCNARADSDSPYKSRLSHASCTPTVSHALARPPHDPPAGAGLPRRAKARPVPRKMLSLVSAVAAKTTWRDLRAGRACLRVSDVPPL